MPSFKVDEFFWLSTWIIRNSFGFILDPTLLVGKIKQVQVLTRFLHGCNKQELRRFFHKDNERANLVVSGKLY